MDFFKQFDELGKKRSVKESQDVGKITRKEETRLFPYKSTAKKGTGEYYATLHDKINVKIIRIIQPNSYSNILPRTLLFLRQIVSISQKT
jgi:hypothetical protein